MSKSRINLELGFLPIIMICFAANHLWHDMDSILAVYVFWKCLLLGMNTCFKWLNWKFQTVEEDLETAQEMRKVLLPYLSQAGKELRRQGNGPKGNYECYAHPWPHMYATKNKIKWPHMYMNPKKQRDHVWTNINVKNWKVETSGVLI